MAGVGERGYVALMAVLVVSAASTAVAVTLLAIGIDSQRTSLVHMRSLQARGLVSACVEEALQQIHDNTSFTGTNNLNLGQGSCTYTVANAGGTNRTITASGTVDTVVRRVSLALSVTTTITVSSWQEVQ